MAIIPSFPTNLLHTASAASVARMQGELARLQREVSTGRHDDLGLALGTATAKDISLRIHLSDVEFNVAQAEQAQPKAQVVQTSLDSIAKVAKNFFEAITGARGAADGQTLAVSAAKAALGSLRDLLNTSYAGQFIFGGQNSATPPMSDPLSGTADAAIDSAFQAEFGMARNDPAVSTITGPAMDSFLSGNYAQLFEQPSWSGNWSSASDSTIHQRVGSTTVEITATANSDFARSLTQAFSMISSLGEGRLSQAAFEAAIDKATGLTLAAQSQLGSEQASIGVAQQRIADEISNLGLRKAALDKAINNLEGVDPYEAATAVNTLMTQLQSSYSITARISQLSLLNYL